MRLYYKICFPRHSRRYFKYIIHASGLYKYDGTIIIGTTKLINSFHLIVFCCIDFFLIALFSIVFFISCNDTLLYFFQCAFIYCFYPAFIHCSFPSFFFSLLLILSCLCSLMLLSSITAFFYYLATIFIAALVYCLFWLLLFSL